MKTRSAAARLWLVGLGLMALSPTASATVQDPNALIAPYLKARDDQAVGEIVGHARGDPARPSEAPVPYEGVSVMLLPHSPGLEAELVAIKAHFRDSLTRYMDATADVTEARAGYEHALLAAGGGELIRGEVSDARGVVRLAQMPAGEWMLLAWRVQWHPAKTPKLKREDTTAFSDVTQSTGHSIVTYWLMRLSVRPRETTEVELNDRNVWLTGVRQDVRVIEGAPKAGSRRRR